MTTIEEQYQAARQRFDATIDAIERNRIEHFELREHANDLDARRRARRAELTGVVAAEEDADGKPLHTNDQKRTARLEELCADDLAYRACIAEQTDTRRQIAVLEAGVERLGAQQRMARFDMEWAIASLNLETGRSA